MHILPYDNKDDNENDDSLALSSAKIWKVPYSSCIINCLISTSQGVFVCLFVFATFINRKLTICRERKYIFKIHTVGQK